MLSGPYSIKDSERTNTKQQSICSDGTYEVSKFISLMNAEINASEF